MHLDPDGTGPAVFGPQVSATGSGGVNVSGFDIVAAQPDRKVDAEAGFAWDRSGGVRHGRVYLVYANEPAAETVTDDHNIFLRHSDDNGATWSAARRVNDDSGTNTQFLPRIAIDQTTGNIAIVWHDTRNDLGAGGTGDTNGVPNDDAQFWGAVSFDGGATFTPNFQISAGTSNPPPNGTGFDYGDYAGLDFSAGRIYATWADNSNSTGDNVDGALSKTDLYTSRIEVIPPLQPGRYAVVVGPNQTVTGLDFGSVQAAVTGRRTFYNHSAFDGGPMAGAGIQAPLDGTKNDDDEAIATDKQALLPGQTATSASYTSYDKGLNGVMIDLRRLPAVPTLGNLADFFTFKVGNDSSPGGSGWVAAPAPTAVAVRDYVGTDGKTSDRVTLIWANGAIKNKWLQVTVNADPADDKITTGLTAADVFYFGNLVGESYVTIVNGQARINAYDAGATKAHVGETATVTNLYDHTRDEIVSAADETAVDNNLNMTLIVLTA